MPQPALDFARDVLLPSPADASALRDRAVQHVTQHAEDTVPGFLERARAFIVTYLRSHGPTPGEDLVIHCKHAGIVPPDDRAFGGAFLSLSRRGVIVRTGTIARRRGHNTQGGSIWALAEAQD